MTTRRDVVLLGSTGSIGTQTVEVAEQAPDRFRIVAVAAGGSDVRALAGQAARLRVRAVGISRVEAADELAEELDRVWPGDVARPAIHVGPQAAVELAALGCDVVLNAVAGARGLDATLAALRAGRDVALANKESLVAGGPLVTGLAGAGQIQPVDSEHSALAQCLRAGTHAEVARLLVTASGGPFRGRTREQMRDVTPAEALAHPTWDMGRLITTNSATMINKGLEVIEAHLLFGIPYERIDVVVHPQSVIHSMVEFTDGSTVAQVSPPDMRLTISLALGWPDRVPGASAPLDWTQAQTWTFEPLDPTAFPAIDLCRRAGTAGGCAPAVLNAANELLVDAFHNGEVGFLQIVDVTADVVDEWLSERHTAAGDPSTVEDVERAQEWARDRARTLGAVPEPAEK